MTLVDKFKEACKRIDTLKEVEIVLEDSNIARKKLYNIHKRSLPVNKDTVIAFRLTYDEAFNFRDKYLKPKIKEIDGVQVLFYYDIIATDATIEERDLYYNDCQIMQEVNNNEAS